MSKIQKFKVDRIIEIGEGVASVGENRYLDATTAFKIGMLGDACKPVVKNFARERDKLLAEARRKQKAIIDPVKEQATNEARIKANEEVAILAQETSDKINEMSQQEEEIKVPSLKLSEFIAKADITDVFVKDGVPETKVVIKAGQSLVPVKFFTALGDLITDDKDTGA